MRTHTTVPDLWTSTMPAEFQENVKPDTLLGAPPEITHTVPTPSPVPPALPVFRAPLDTPPRKPRVRAHRPSASHHCPEWDH